MTHFDEVGRWIRWSKNEFSHRLSPQPTAVRAHQRLNIRVHLCPSVVKIRIVPADTIGTFF